MLASQLPYKTTWRRPILCCWDAAESKLQEHILHTWNKDASVPKRLQHVRSRFSLCEGIERISSSLQNISYARRTSKNDATRAANYSEQKKRNVTLKLCNLYFNTNNVFMASFDISSLFTNVPIGETIDIVINRLFPSTQFLGFSHIQFWKLLYFAVKNGHFLFNPHLCEQVDGVAMGFPLGPLFANTFLCCHEKIWLDNCLRDFKPLIYRCYVDDCFVIFRCFDHVKPFLDYLNFQVRLG